MNRTTRPTFVWVALFVALWLGTAVLFWTIWIHGTYHTDFYPWWAGVRVWLSSKGAVSLYDLETTQHIQRLLYGHLLAPTQDQQGFAYPAPLALVILPFAMLPNREIAAALWTGLGCSLTVLLVYLWTRSARQVLWVLSWPFMMVALYQAQIEPLIGGLLLGSVMAASQKRDTWSGFLTPFALLKPQSTLLFVVGWLVHMLRTRRGKALRAFGISAFVLFGGSLLLWGWWVPEWVAALSRYKGYAQVVWAPRIWAYSRVGGLLWTLIFVGLVLRAGRQARRNPAFEFVLALSLPLAMLLLPQSPIWSLGFLPMSLILVQKNQVPRLSNLLVSVVGWLSFAGYLVWPASRWWMVQMQWIPLLVLFAVQQTWALSAHGSGSDRRRGPATTEVSAVQ